mmetsp:Transcript_54775/g.130857  ORF Transcript_54775/g.130857 Transcript_54775/m.130857 type:complete len:212 (-) Transcript_54775:2452-3087(-)
MPGAVGLYRRAVASAPVRPVREEAVVGAGLLVWVARTASLRAALLSDPHRSRARLPAVLGVLVNLPATTSLTSTTRLGAFPPLRPLRELAVLLLGARLARLRLLLWSCARRTKGTAGDSNLAQPRLLTTGLGATTPGRPVGESALLCTLALWENAGFGLFQISCTRFATVVVQPGDLARPGADAVACGRLTPIHPVVELAILWNAGRAVLW